VSEIAVLQQVSNFSYILVKISYLLIRWCIWFTISTSWNNSPG